MLDLHPTSAGTLAGVYLTGVAAQKSCRRRIHAASSSSHTAPAQLSGTGPAFSSSTGTLSNSDKLRSLDVHTSRRTRSFSSTISGPAASSKNVHGSQPALTNESSGEFAGHLNKTFGGSLVFPPELATRLLTHASHPSSKFVGHNGRFAFVGEWVFLFWFVLALPLVICCLFRVFDFVEKASN